ncbi:hypothetical protein ACDA63_01165 [Uliginosibacterium sp. sgz301328]|uniref:hypothetical protein n=1 Tax=Uliginosibacterium sp. sgz301328 TaxID=3243764 RepID=UPI00359EFA2C
MPDIAGLRRLYAVPARMSDDDVAEYAWQKQRAFTGGSDTLPHHLHLVTAIARVWRDDSGLHVVAQRAGDGIDEAALLREFFDALDANDSLVSWQGSRFGLPVLRCRAVIHGLSAPVLGLRENGAHVDLAAELSPEDLPLSEMAALAGPPAHTSEDPCAVEAVQTYFLHERLRVMCGEVALSNL